MFDWIVLGSYFDALLLTPHITYFKKNADKIILVTLIWVQANQNMSGLGLFLTKPDGFFTAFAFLL